MSLRTRQLLSRPGIEKKFVSSDGTMRYLMRLADAQAVETVWMPEGDGGETGDGSDSGDGINHDDARDWHRTTICVSSQVGCAVDCQFCLTALIGDETKLDRGRNRGTGAARCLRISAVSLPVIASIWCSWGWASHS